MCDWGVDIDAAPGKTRFASLAAAGLNTRHCGAGQEIDLQQCIFGHASVFPKREAPPPPTSMSVIRPTKICILLSQPSCKGHRIL
jgi:hypothetical protein